VTLVRVEVGERVAGEAQTIAEILRHDRAVVRRDEELGAIKDISELAADDYRRHDPRFQGENLRRNLRLADRVRAVAAEAGVTPTQLALAWLLHQGDDIVPIPGTKRVTYLEENAAAADIELTADQLAEIEAALAPGAAAGLRYPEQLMDRVDN
jgi:hypothetical protein